MKPQRAQAGSGLVPVEDEPVSSSAGIHFMQDARIAGGGNPPSFFAQAQAKFGVLPVEKKTLIQKSSIFQGSAGDQHAGAIKGVKPVISPRHGCVATVTDPEIYARATPSFHYRGRVGVIADGADGSDAIIAKSLGDEG